MKIIIKKIQDKKLFKEAIKRQNIDKKKFVGIKEKEIKDFKRNNINKRKLR